MTDLEIFTQAEVLDRLPEWMRSDFDCPDHGPHDWLPGVTARGNVYTFCRNCNRLNRSSPCLDIADRDPHDVVYSLQFPR